MCNSRKGNKMDNNTVYRVKSRDSMKTVDVIFVSDELVGSTIVPKKEYERLIRQKLKSEAERVKSEEIDFVGENKTPKRKSSQNDSDLNDNNSKRSKSFDDVELALAALEKDDVEKIDVSHPSTLFDEGDVSAKAICHFGGSHQQLKNQNSEGLTNNLKNKSSTNVGKQKETKLPTILEDPWQTPFTVRKRVIKDIKQIQKILENSDEDFSGSDSDSSFSMSDNSLSDGTSNVEDMETKHSKSSKSLLKSYYDFQGGKKSKVSLNSLKKLKTPVLTQEKLDEIIKNFKISSVHKKCIKMIISEILSMFTKWDFILKQNFNLLLYGAGSKREIIGKFVERFIDVFPVIVVNGFFPDIAAKEILEKVCSILSIKFDSADIIEKIEKKIKNYDIEIYLAINNIDGVMLRNKKIQNMLSQLGKIEQIHIIASVDHINAPLIWDKRTCSEFNWVWFDSTTFLSYSEETLYEVNLMLHSSGKATLASLRNVFAALTKNSQGIFLVMLKNQLGSTNKKNGISFRELYEECRRELLISSDVALRAQLKEFMDHMILKQKKTADGEEQFVIVMENNILKQFLEEQQSQES